MTAAPLAFAKFPQKIDSADKNHRAIPAVLCKQWLPFAGSGTATLIDHIIGDGSEPHLNG